MTGGDPRRHEPSPWSAVRLWPRRVRCRTLHAPLFAGPESRAAELKTIAAEKAPVTWCLVGRWAEAHADLVREMVRTARSADVAVTF